MSIHVALHHVTHYTYDRPVQLGPQVVRLRPAPHSRSRILSYSLKVEPEEHFINWQQDAFANYQARLVFPKKTTAFKVTVDMVTEMAVFNPFDFFLEPSAEEVPFKYSDTVQEELRSYLDKANKTPLFKNTWPAWTASANAPLIFWCRSTNACTKTSATPSAWSRVCKRPKKRSSSAVAHAATQPGFWCNSSGT